MAPGWGIKLVIWPPPNPHSCTVGTRKISCSAHAQWAVLLMRFFAMITWRCASGMLFWWFLFAIKVLAQLPELSVIARPGLFGRCTSLESSMLGDFHYPSTLGLVPHSLMAIARRDQYSRYYTTELPSVRVMSAVRTCQSHDVSVSKYNTASFLISYSCRGIACNQPPGEVQNRTYVHLFSFICRNSNHYTSWDFIPGFEVHINRSTTNSISKPVTTLSGSCTLCTNDPAFNHNPQFDPVTGCICKLRLKSLMHLSILCPTIPPPPP